MGQQVSVHRLLRGPTRTDSGRGQSSSPVRDISEICRQLARVRVPDCKLLSTGLRWQHLSLLPQPQIPWLQPQTTAGPVSDTGASSQAGGEPAVALEAANR